MSNTTKSRPDSLVLNSYLNFIDSANNFIVNKISEPQVKNGRRYASSNFAKKNFQFEAYRKLILEFETVILTVDAASSALKHYRTISALLKKLGQVIKPKGSFIKNYKPFLLQRFETLNTTTNIEYMDILDICLYLGKNYCQLAFDPDDENQKLDLDFSFLEHFWIEENVLKCISIILYGKVFEINPGLSISCQKSPIPKHAKAQSKNSDLDLITQDNNDTQALLNSTFNKTGLPMSPLKGRHNEKSSMALKKFFRMTRAKISARHGPSIFRKFLHTYYYTCVNTI